MGHLESLTKSLKRHFTDFPLSESYRELTLEVPAYRLPDVALMLRDDEAFQFEQLIDVAVVDYLHYGRDEWKTDEATGLGFSRGVEPRTTGRLKFGLDDENSDLDTPRFAAIYHLISYHYNRRLRLRVYAPNDDLPVIPSVINIWNSADWYEREGFDLYGVVFEGHPDLRRILTDYGFIGHPFRKDFPLVGNVEMRYDPEKQRVVYEPVSIEPRVLVPRVIRDDNRYLKDNEQLTSGDSNDNA